MENKILIHNENDLRSKIYNIRGVQVMLDRDLAEIYGYTVKAFNQQVKNNIEKFDEDFRFQLTKDEFDEWNLKSNFLTSSFEEYKTEPSNWGGVRKLPYAFTEQGIYMLMTVLRGDLATKQSKMLIRMFKDMKHFLSSNAQLFQRLDFIEHKQIESDIHHKKNDKKIAELFTLMDKYNVNETQGIFFQGQIFDAYVKFENFLSQAASEIILIDSYVDLSVLDRLAKKKIGVNVVIYTAPKTKLTTQDIQKFNAQYPLLTITFTNKIHDRFLIIDRKTLYHIGASLKDLGKKCFAFEVLDSSLITPILQNI